MGEKWICEQNRTGKSVKDLPEIANSGLILYELKVELASCHNCNDYTRYDDKPYCLKLETEK